MAAVIDKHGNFWWYIFLVELYVELTLRAVILSESTVECLKMYHKDWPISLLTNF